MCNKSKARTERQLIKFLYKETTPAEREEIVPEVFGNPQMKEEFEELLDMKRELDQIVFTPIERAPSERCVSNILAFAKQAIGK